MRNVSYRIKVANVFVTIQYTLKLDASIYLWEIDFTFCVSLIRTLCSLGKLQRFVNIVSVTECETYDLMRPDT